MKLGITVDALLSPMTGIGRYTKELCEGIAASAPHIDLAFFDSVRWRRDLPSVNQKLRRSRFKLLRAVERATTARGFRDRICHGTNFFLPDKADSGIITVHDLSVLRYPESHPVERVRIFENRFQSSLERARHIITDSETVRQEVLDFTGRSPEEVTAITLGVSSNFSPLNVESAHLPASVIPGLDSRDYILCVATLEPRKRIDAAILAHAQFRERTKRDLPLVLIGAAGWRNDHLHDMLRPAIDNGRVIALGYVPDADLPRLYADASLFIYPSIYEGFGLPPLEAMASGTPTIVANRSCLPEITQGAAALVDPDDIEAFSHEIERCLDDLPWRTSAIAAGLRVAHGYSWESCVDRTLRLYERLSKSA